jgi:hypothetical protein
MLFNYGCVSEYESLCIVENKKGDKIFKILNSETTGPIGTNLCLDSPWMTPFQNCVRQTRHPTKIATVAKIEKEG